MFKKLFFAVAFASAVLAQDFTVAVPVNKVQAGKSMTVLLQSTVRTIWKPFIVSFPHHSEQRSD